MPALRQRNRHNAAENEDGTNTGLESSPVRNSSLEPPNPSEFSNPWMRVEIRQEKGRKSTDTNISSSSQSGAAHSPSFDEKLHDQHAQHGHSSSAEQLCSQEVDDEVAIIRQRLLSKSDRLQESDGADTDGDDGSVWSDGGGEVSVQWATSDVAQDCVKNLAKAFGERAVSFDQNTGNAAGQRKPRSSAGRRGNASKAISLDNRRDSSRARPSSRSRPSGGNIGHRKHQSSPKGFTSSRSRAASNRSGPQAVTVDHEDERLVSRRRAVEEEEHRLQEQLRALVEKKKELALRERRRAAEKLAEEKMQAWRQSEQERLTEGIQLLHKNARKKQLECQSYREELEQRVEQLKAMIREIDGQERRLKDETRAAERRMKAEYSKKEQEMALHLAKQSQLQHQDQTEAHAT